MDSVTNHLQPDMPRTIDDWLDVFRQKRGQPLEELQVLEQALQSHPEAPALWARLAQVRLDLKQYDEAEWAARQGTQLDDMDYESWYVLGRVQESRGKLYEALAAHRKLLEIAPNDSTALNAIAHDLTIAGDPSQALSIFEALHAQEPETTRFEVGLSRALLGLGRLTAAQAHLDHVIRLNPNLSGAYVLSAQVQNFLLRRDAWVQVAHQAYALRPDLPINIQWRVRALIAEERVEEGVTLLQQGLEQNPEAYLLCIDLARVWMSQGDEASALTLMARAGELAPFHGEVIAEQARIACALRQPVDWAGLIGRAQTQPFNHRLAIRVGTLCLEYGDVAEGLRLLELGTEGTEDIPGLTALGTGLMGEARFEEAHTALQRAVTPNIDRPETDQAMAGTWRAAALAAYAAEHNDLARQAFERALPWHEDDVQLWYAYGLLMFEVEDWAAGQAAFEHVLAQNPEHTEARQAYKALRSRRL